MKYLYIDNFRGFTNTLIPLKNMTFFVGENSTGKTSILSLIYLLSSNRFWLTFSFNDDEVLLGNFKDIINIWSENEKDFKVGFIDSTNEKQKPYAFLLTFIEKDGYPYLKSLIHISEKQEVIIRVTTRSIKYKIKPINNEENFDINEIIQIFQNEEQETVLSGYKLAKLSKAIKGIKLASGLSLHLILRELDIKSPLSNMLNFNIFEELVWIAPIRSKPKRIYDESENNFSSEGSHIPYMLKKILRDKKNSKPFLNKINLFGKESALFDSIETIHFGKNVASPFKLNIILNNKSLNISKVGYGVSQSLPVIAELLSCKPKSWFLVQQPEVHLHPKAQATFGDLFYKFAIE